MTNCESCARIKQRDAGRAPDWDAIVRTDDWDVVHCYDTSLLGWIVLVTRRHIESVDQLTDAEAEALGYLLKTVSVFLKSYLGCTKTYIMQFAEHPQHPHVHFHVVPRMPDIPAANVGANVFNYLGVGAAEQVTEREMNRLAAQLRQALRPGSAG